MDEADIAQVMEGRYLNAAIQAVLGSGVRDQGPGFSAFECVDCEEEIPEARREAVPECIRCVGCQAMTEGRGRRTRRNQE